MMFPFLPKTIVIVVVFSNPTLLCRPFQLNCIPNWFDIKYFIIRLVTPSIPEPPKEASRCTYESNHALNMNKNTQKLYQTIYWLTIISSFARCSKFKNSSYDINGKDGKFSGITFFSNEIFLLKFEISCTFNRIWLLVACNFASDVKTISWKAAKVIMLK